MAPAGAHSPSVLQSSRECWNCVAHFDRAPSRIPSTVQCDRLVFVITHFQSSTGGGLFGGEGIDRSWGQTSSICRRMQDVSTQGRATSLLLSLKSVADFTSAALLVLYKTLSM